MTKLEDKLAKSLKELYGYVAVTNKVTPHDGERMDKEEKILKKASLALGDYDKRKGLKK